MTGVLGSRGIVLCSKNKGVDQLRISLHLQITCALYPNNCMQTVKRPNCMQTVERPKCMETVESPVGMQTADRSNCIPTV